MKLAHTTAFGWLIVLQIAAAVKIHGGDDLMVSSSASFGSQSLLGAPNVVQLEDELLAMVGEPVQKPSNGTAMDEDKLGHLATGLAKLKTLGKATPEMMGFVNTVNKMIKDDMMPKILAGHKKNSDQVTTLMKAFLSCKGKKTSEWGKLKTDRAKIWSFSSAQKTCRRQQQSHYRLKYDCTRLVAAKKRVMKSDCDRQKLLMRDPNKEADNCHTTNKPEPYGSWLLRNYRWFHAKDKVYDAAKKRCDRSRAAYEREKPKCDKKIAAWKVKVGKCNGKQDLLEGQTCTVAKGMLKSCTEYRQCFRNAMRALGEQEPNIRKMVRDRKYEWRALKRIECLLGVFAEEDGDVDATQIDKCRAITHSTTHLDIKFPKVPPRERCAATPATPCTTSYINRHYGGLPKNSKAKKCNMCVIKTRGFGQDPTVWLKAEDFVPKTSAWANEGSLGDYRGTAITRSKPRLDLQYGNGARSPILAVTGSYQTSLNFGRVINRYYTICSLTRYTNRRHGGYRKRILNGAGRNWLHGHWMGRAGVAYYNGWKTRHSPGHVSTMNWVAACGKNQGGRPNNILINGKAVGRHTGGHNPHHGLYVNAGVYGNEKSDFAIAEIMIWDSPLSDYHMQKAMSYLMGKLREKISSGELKRRKEIVNQKIKPAYWFTPQKMIWSTGQLRNMGTRGMLKHNIVSTGRLRLSYASGYGASQKVLAFAGDWNTRLNFGPVFRHNVFYTICSLSRYTSRHAHRRKRILMGSGRNWLHGHWMGRAGAVYYAGWKTGWWGSLVPGPRYGNMNWAAICGTNGLHTPTNVIVNGREEGRHRGGHAPSSLMVNQGVYGNERSDFAIAEVKIWDKTLPRYFMQKEMQQMMAKLRTRPSSNQEKKNLLLMKEAFGQGSRR